MVYFSELIKHFHWSGKFQVYIASAEHPTFQFLEGVEEEVRLPFSRFTVQEQDIVKIEEDYTFLLFTFPHDYQILLNIYEYKPEKDEELVGLYHYMYPYYTRAAIKRERYKLEQIIESTRRASSSLNPEEIYDNILSYALDVIPNGDIGTLWWYDDKRDRLLCKASLGNILQGIRHMEFKVGEGPVGYTFQTGKSVLYNQNQQEIWKEIGHISSENKIHWDQSYEFSKEVRSFLLCPIKINNRVEGVMFLCQILKPFTLTEDDLQLLEGFSSQVGIAIRNARQYSRIKKLNEKLMKRDEIHSVLTKLSMQTSGISKIIEEMAKMMGRNLIFVDLLDHDIIPSAKRLPNYLTFHNLNEILQECETPFYELKRSGYVTHALYPIRLEQVVLGCIIVEVKGEIRQMESIVLEQGHSVLALELTRKQHLIEFYYKKKRDAFHELLNAKNVEVLQQKASELMISPNEPFIVVLFRMTEEISPYEMELYLHKMTAQIKRELFSYIQLLFADNGTVTVVSRASKLEEKQVRKAVKKIYAEWEKRKDVTVSCGIGNVYENVQSLRKSYQEAEKVLSYLESRKEPGIMDYSEIGVNRLFIHQNQEEIQQFISEVFTPLETQQSINNSLKETLIMYFSHNRSASKTAQVMHIHINTLYQRLKKIEETLQLSFEDAEHVLRLQLACYLKQIYS